LPGERILVVEDESIVAQDLKDRLETMGYDVVGIAGTACDAISKAGDLCPDLALMDIRLGGNGDGIEAAGTLRMRHDIPSIYITAYADEETLGRARATEPLGYLVKPFQDRELHASIEMGIHRHKAEKALRASELRLRTLVQLAPDAIIMADIFGAITLCNRAAASLFGYTEAELAGRRLSELFNVQDDGKGAAVVAELARTGSIHNLEMAVPSCGGEPVPVEVSASALREDGGAPGGFVAIWRDISDRKRAEKERTMLQLELLQAQKLSAIGELAAGVAHELNNPLTGILLYSELSLKKLGAQGPERDGYLQKLPKDLEMIRDSALRCDRIVRGLLELSRRGPPEKELVDMNGALRSTIGVLARYLEAQRIAIVEKLDADLPPVEGDKNTLQQVFVNIIRNAQDAMPDGGVLTIVSRKLDKARLEIAVTDTGMGISRQNRSKLFQPFFTTKPPGKGTGLGLAISYGIVREHGGTIGVQSAEGKGTTFSLVFPVALAPDGNKNMHPPGGGAG
jgi:two-component system cell cycle sensor histidine kinase/response regulator CckA